VVPDTRGPEQDLQRAARLQVCMTISRPSKRLEWPILLNRQSNTVAPAKAGAQLHRLDSGFRRNDEFGFSIVGLIRE
jgi:hypothetical protein